VPDRGSTTDDNPQRDSRSLGDRIGALDRWVDPHHPRRRRRRRAVLAGLVPDEPEVHGLVALMELHASRAPARTGSTGESILLLDQDRTRWNQALRRRGLAALDRAGALGGARGLYALQAAISACHARAHRAADTDWAQIAALYQELGRLIPSPVIALNHAVAVSMAEGPAAGLALVDALTAVPALSGYHLLPSARADMLAKLGRWAEARAEFERAAALTHNARQRALLLEKAAACARDGGPLNPATVPC
jgi:RNA polymerase sigma-70 factor, ECF subfamily